jgi:hypothetical protein
VFQADLCLPRIYVELLTPPFPSLRMEPYLKIGSLHNDEINYNESDMTGFLLEKVKFGPKHRENTSDSQGTQLRFCSCKR